MFAINKPLTISSSLIRLRDSLLSVTLSVETNSNVEAFRNCKTSVPLDTRFGDAAISEKHCNFFINKDKASFKDMKKLINFVEEKVLDTTGVKLSLEIILVE